jgi:hypothetical protein
VMNLFPGGLICFRFQKTTMLSGCIAAEVNSAGIAASLSPLPGGSAESSVHGIELSVLAQWALTGLFGVIPPLHTYASFPPTLAQTSSRMRVDAGGFGKCKKPKTQCRVRFSKWAILGSNQ